MNRTDFLRLPWRVSITDATGSTRSCRMISARVGLRKYPCTLPPETARRALRRIARTTMLPWGIGFAIFFAAFAPVFLYADELAAIGGHFLWFGLVAVMLALYLTIGLAPMSTAYRRTHLRFFAESRHCAWCLYNLDGVPADGGGLTLCPECGGVWQLPPPAPTL